MPEDRAIDVNSLNGNPFPVIIEYSVKENSFSVHLAPLSVAEVADLLPAAYFLIFNVDTHDFDGSGIATLSKTEDNPSAFIKKFDEEILLMTKEQVISFVNSVGHYNFNLLAVEAGIDVEKILQVLELAEAGMSESTIIDKLDSELYLNSHDDCYLYVETNDKSLVERLVSLQIKTLVATHSKRSVSELRFDASELTGKGRLSVVIPPMIEFSEGRVSWKVLDGTFKDFVYGKEMPDIGLRLVLAGVEIEIEKVRSDETPDRFI
jgi:hypothetical protein